MFNNKTNRMVGFLGFTLIGAVYLSAFSSLDLHPVFKGQLVLLPVQFAALLYFLWWKQRDILR